MEVTIIGTYPPRECGIGTFTQHLYGAILRASRQNHGSIVALNHSEKEYSYPPEVRQIIRQDNKSDYIKVAKNINSNGTDICILQHEYGIYGGKNGVYILQLLHWLEKPLVVTLHTIVKVPSYGQKAILQAICQKACKVVVMNEKAIGFLVDIYGVSPEKIVLIQHGVPEYHFDHLAVKREFNLEHKKVILTFGFLGRNKGIDVAISALPKLIKKHPEIVYIVLGKTHPNVLRCAGEEYLNYLRHLVEKLDLTRYVIIPHQYVDQDELFKYLYASDIYITPYNSEAQITSGTLSYAIGVGSGVISTPYWHAVELLANNRGRLFNFNDSNELSDILIELLDKPELLNQIRKNAYEYGKEMTWPKIGKKYNDLLISVAQNYDSNRRPSKQLFDISLMPPFSLKHIQRLSDTTGIIQHAKYGIPNYKEGYCLDDNSRALLMALMADSQMKSEAALELCTVYLSYIYYMQNDDGTFRNFLSYNGDFIDNVGSEDAFGRTIWAIGYLLSNPPNDSFYQMGHFIFRSAAPHFETLKSIRSIAYAIAGLSHYLKSHPNNDSIMEVLRRLSNKLMQSYEVNSTKDWNWFEPILTYDNAIMPMALLHAAKLLNGDAIHKAAILTMKFLIQHTFSDGYLSTIGNQGWFKQNGDKACFAQQPLDTLSMVLMFHQAFYLTKDKTYLQQLFTSYLWFLGENDLRIRLYDEETNGCCDGLEHDGVNRNQGAESTLAYLISHLTVLQAHQEYLNS